MTENNPLKDAGPPLTPDQIEQLEQQLGAALPDDYRRFLLQSNGGTPRHPYFEVHVGPAPQWMVPKWRAKWDERQEPWIDYFYVIDENLAEPNPDAAGTLAFWRAADWLMLPADALPIATVTRDDVLLLYLTGSRRGEVHLMCSDYLDAAEETTPEAVERAIRFVAATFGAFYASLRESREG